MYMWMKYFRFLSLVNEVEGLNKTAFSAGAAELLLELGGWGKFN